MAKLLTLIALLFCALLAQTTEAKKKVTSDVVKPVEPKDEKSTSDSKAIDIKDAEEDSDEELDSDEDDFDKKEEPTPKALKKSPSSKNESKTANKKPPNEKTETSETNSKQNTDEDRFKLKNFDKLIFSQSGPINEKWHKFGYTVIYKRDSSDWSSNKLSLDWIKGKDKVIMRKKPNSDITQKWTFEDVNISIISKVSSGEMKQIWKFGTSTYQYSRNRAGQVKSKWTKGKADTKILEKHQNFIERWCTDNDFLIPRAHCVVYNK